MNDYKYFNFRNFVAVNVGDDFFFLDAIGFWRQSMVLELREASLKGSPVPGGYVFPLALAEYRKMKAELTPAAFEKCLSELLPLMEEGLVVIGKGQHKEKTSYGYYALKQPEGGVYDAILEAREDFLKDKEGFFEWTWMIQATTKGWEWAKDQKKHIDFAVYNDEDGHFFTNNFD